MNQTYEETGREIGSLKEESMNNPIKPAHYDGEQCLEAIKAATKGLDGFEGFCVGNIIKYSWRWKQKNGIEDIGKAKQYMEFLERYVEEKGR